MRVGFVGTGHFAGEHAKKLKELDCSLAACYGTKAEKTAAFAAEFGAKIFGDPISMIRREHIDVLIIAVPPFAHDGSVELAAVRERIPFLVEKPLGLDAGVCRRVADAVQAAGLVTSVGYLLRELPPLEQARQIARRNRIASIRSTNMVSFPKKLWWRKMALSGGPMVEMSTHFVDLLRYTFGEVREVMAAASWGICKERFEGCDVQDSMEAIMVFRSGAVGSIGISNVVENGATRTEMFEAFGRDLALSYNFDRLRYKEGPSDWAEVPMPWATCDPLLEQDRRFLAAARDGNPSAVRCPYADGLKTLELTLAMNQSVITGEPVAIGD